MARQPTGKLELYVGTFIIAGTILLMGMILKVTDIGFRNTYVVVVQLPHIGDLKEGAPVKRGGVQIGNVDKIELKKDLIQIKVDIHETVELTDDCKVRIETAGVVGDTFLEFSQGTSSRMLDTKVKTIKDAMTGVPWKERGRNVVQGEGQISINALFSQVEEIGVELTSIAKNINDIIGDKEVKDEIRESIHNLSVVTSEANSFLKNLSKASESIVDASQDIAESTERIKAMSATIETAVNDTIGDKRTREAINETMANLQTLSKEIAGKSTQIGETIDNVKVVSAKVKDVAQAIDPKKGILRFITTDEGKKWLDQIGKSIGTVADTIAKVGLTDVLADNKAADRIFNEFVTRFEKEHGRRRDNPELFQRKWKEFKIKSIKETGHLIDPKFGEGGWREEFGHEKK